MNILKIHQFLAMGKNKTKQCYLKNQFHWILSNYLDVRKRQSCPRKSVAAFWHADSLFQLLGFHQAGGVVLFLNKDTCCQEGHFTSVFDSNTSTRSRCHSLPRTKIKVLPQMAQLHPLKYFSLSCYCNCTPLECSDRPDGKRSDDVSHIWQDCSSLRLRKMSFVCSQVGLLSVFCWVFCVSF